MLIAENVLQWVGVYDNMVWDLAEVEILYVSVL